MPEQPALEPVPIHADVRYEKRDARPGPILLFGAGLVIAGIVIQGALVFMFDVFKKDVETGDPQLSPLAARERLKLPGDIRKIPAPVLQQSETKDLDRLRQADDERLESYGWVDAKNGILHIPIGEAMRLLADSKTGATHGIRVQSGNQKGGR